MIKAPATNKPLWNWLTGIATVVLFFLISIQLRIDFEPSFTVFDFSFTLIKAVPFLVNYLWLYPLFFRRKRYWTWALTSLALIMLGIGLRALLEEVIFPATIGYGNYYKGTTIPYYIRDNFVRIMPWILVGTAIRFVQDLRKADHDKKMLERQRTEAELALLKSQLNPHFLFNTLNSIYALAYQQSGKAPDAILKLSEVLRYLLYDSEGSQVPLEKELQYLHSFIDLQKARFKETIYIDVLVEGVITNQQIVPVLLIAFVENAFKHGVLNAPEDPVLIQVTIEGNRLQLVVQNRISHQEKDDTGGIGMPNIRRRLELLYSGRHDLHVRETHTHYICELSLEL